MFLASIDIGTNSVLLLVVEGIESTQNDKSSKSKFKNYKIKNILHDEATVTRTGQGVDQSGKLHPDAINRTIKCLKRYAEIAKSFGVSPSEIKCVATSATRDSSNRNEFIEKALSESGIRIQVISGEKEAELSFKGAFPEDVSPNKSLVLDIGGGSTEFIYLSDHIEKISLNIGSVRLFERFLKSDPPTESQWEQMLDFIKSEIKSVKFDPSIVEKNAFTLLGIAGTVTTLAALVLGLEKFDRDTLDGYELRQADLENKIIELKSMTNEARQKIPGLDPGRSDVILAGGAILSEVMKAYGFEVCKVSIRGLRYALVQK